MRIELKRLPPASSSWKRRWVTQASSAPALGLRTASPSRRDPDERAAPRKRVGRIEKAAGGPSRSGPLWKRARPPGLGAAAPRERGSREPREGFGAARLDAHRAPSPADGAPGTAPHRGRLPDPGGDREARTDLHAARAAYGRAEGGIRARGRRPEHGPRPIGPAHVTVHQLIHRRADSVWNRPGPNRSRIAPGAEPRPGDGRPRI